MKTAAFLLVMVFWKMGFSQETPRYFKTEKQNYYFAMTRSRCVVYEISKRGELWDTQELQPDHSFSGQSDSIGVLFSNEFFAVSYDYKYFRLSKVKFGGGISSKKTYVATAMEDPAIVYNAINMEYWGKVYDETVMETERKFPDFNSRYYSYYHRELPPLNFLETPEAFRAPADEFGRELRDSLDQKNQNCTDLRSSVIKNMDTINLGELKSIYSRFPLNAYEYEEYYSETINLVAAKRPDLFYELAESMPIEREHLFSTVSFSKEVQKPLKKYETKAPIKKEYFKYKHITRLKDGLVITGLTVLQIGLTTGLIGLLL